MAASKPFHVVTPLRVSPHLSKLAGTKVYLKLECAQPTCSFKIRGIGNLCKASAEKGCLQFVCASAGNAGLAAAYSARLLGIPAIIFVPKCTPAFTVERLKDEGATVCMKETLDECTKTAKALAERNKNWTYVPPFDDPLIWDGHMTMVQEMKEQMEGKPGAVILSVGGGGLLCGVIKGLREVGWDGVPIIAMETCGAHSLNASLEKKELVTLPEITSVATTLGATTVAEEAFKLAQEYPVLAQAVNDSDAVAAVAKFLDDERLLVEPACGASLAAIYSEVTKALQKDGKLPNELESIVIIVCGGNNITLAELERLQEELGTNNGMDDLVECEIALATWCPTNMGSFVASHHQSKGACD